MKLKYIILLIIGIMAAAATYYGPSRAEETKYRLEHQKSTVAAPAPAKPKKVVYSVTWTREVVE